jgi:exonuclease VII large subunit
MHLKYITLERKLKNYQMEKRLNELTHIHDYYLRLDENIVRIKRSINTKFERLALKLEKYSSVMSALNPQNVLGRGYSYTETENGVVVTCKKDFDELGSGAKLNIHFSDGLGLVIKKT